MRSVLKLAAYRRLLSAYTLNQLAWSIGSLALAILVYKRTGSAIGATAFFLCSQFLPALVAPWAVARLDQRRQRLVLPLLYALEAIVYLALAWVASHFELAGLLALATLEGVIAITARALSRSATVAVTAAAGLLREGNALANSAFSITYMLGPAIGGAVVALDGTSTALLANAVLFAVITVTLATTRGLPQPASEPAPAAGRVKAALALARRRPAIRALLTLQAVALVFFTISIPVEVVLAQHTLHAGASGYGALLAAWGAGAVAGSAIYARWRRLPVRNLIAFGAFALGVGFLVMGAAPTIAVAVAGAAVAGIGNGIEAVAARTALQESVEQIWMALMMSLNESIYQLMPGPGLLLGGAITALASPRIALFVAGGGALAVTVGAWTALGGTLRGSAVLESRPAVATNAEPRATEGPRVGAPTQASRHQ